MDEILRIYNLAKETAVTIKIEPEKKHQEDEDQEKVSNLRPTLDQDEGELTGEEKKSAPIVIDPAPVFEAAAPNRATLYKALEEIGALLMVIDPHSPSGEMVQYISTWNNKTLGQILNDEQTIPSQTKAVLKFLASGLCPS